jgi:tetratricopeptide (TPR) repeat protein
MIHRLWLGDLAGASVLARQCELARLEQSRAQTGDALATLWALQAHVASDDLTHTRQYLVAAERLAAKMHTWQPIAAWARGEYQRIRGDHEAALAALDEALAQLPEAAHQVWPFAAGARVRVLCEQGRFAEAREAGERYLAAAEGQGLGYVTNYIRMPLAVAMAKLGDADAARSHAQVAIASLEALGARGINLGLAYEAAARVAAYTDNQADVDLYMGRCKESFLAFPNAALSAKYQRLRRSLRARSSVGASLPGHVDFVSLVGRSQMESMLQTCATSEQRLQCALDLLVKGAGAEGGALYAFADGTLQLRAQTHEQGLPPEVESQALRYAQEEISACESATASASQEGQASDAWTCDEGRYYRPVLLNHSNSEGFVASGLVVLAFDSLQPTRVAADATAFLSRRMVQAGDLAPVLIAV